MASVEVLCIVLAFLGEHGHFMLIDLIEDLDESVVTEIGRPDGIVREVFHQNALRLFQKFELAFVAGHVKNGIALPSGLDRHIGAEDMSSVAGILIHGAASNICFAIFLSEAPKEALATSTAVLQLVKLRWALALANIIGLLAPRLKTQPLALVFVQ